MFDMGFLEMLLIGVIALIVLGPERLPKAARTVGLWVAKARQGFDAIKTEIEQELQVKELQEQIAKQKAQLESELKVDNNSIDSLKDELKETAESFQTEITAIKDQATISVEKSDTKKKTEPTEIDGKMG